MMSDSLRPSTFRIFALVALSYLLGSVLSGMLGPQKGTPHPSPIEDQPAILAGVQSR